MDNPIYITAFSCEDFDAQKKQRLRDAFSLASLVPDIYEMMTAFNQNGDGFEIGSYETGEAGYDHTTGEIYLAPDFSAVDIAHEVRHWVQFDHWHNFFDEYGDILNTHPQFSVLVSHAIEADAYAVECLFSLSLLRHMGSAVFDSENGEMAARMINDVANHYAHLENIPSAIIEAFLMTDNNDYLVQDILRAGFEAYYHDRSLVHNYLYKSINNMTDRDDLFDPAFVSYAHEQFAMTAYETEPYLSEAKDLLSKSYGGIGRVLEPAAAYQKIVTLRDSFTPVSDVENMILNDRRKKLVNCIKGALKNKAPSHDFQKIMTGSHRLKDTRIMVVDDRKQSGTLTM